MRGTEPRACRLAGRGLRVLHAGAAAAKVALGLWRWPSHAPVRTPRIRPVPACAKPRAKRCRKSVVTFCPRWFSDFQARLADMADGNQMAWPDRMTPVFGCVVAPDGDTQYAAGFFDLSAEPVILTIPPIDVSYPVSAVDAYRATFSNINVHDAGTYALTGPGWTQDPPPGITLTHVPDIFPVWMFRAGRFSNANGQTAAAQQACQHRITRRTAQRRSERLRPVAPGISPPADRAGCCEPGGQA